MPCIEKTMAIIDMKAHFGVRSVSFYLFPASKMINRWFPKSLIKSFINNPISQCLDRQRRVNFEFDAPFRIKLPNLLLLLPNVNLFSKTTFQQSLPMEFHYQFTRLVRGCKNTRGWDRLLRSKLKSIICFWKDVTEMVQNRLDDIWSWSECKFVEMYFVKI